MIKRLRVLLTNDDGFSAPGIQCLYLQLKNSYDVTVVAPEEEQSGIGHAFTFHKPLRYRKRTFHEDSMGYSVSGTPADCVKFALGYLLAETPDIIVSGINDGNNAGVAAYYSGTIAAVREGALWGVCSMAFSLHSMRDGFCSEYAQVADRVVRRIAGDVFVRNSAGRIFYNVNFPSCHPRACNGIKMTRQSLSFWNDIYHPVKTNDDTEYWLSGDPKAVEQSGDFDTRAVADGYITITPLQLDATAPEGLKAFEDMDKILENKEKQ